MSMFHLIYIPETPLHDRSKFIKGNGNHRGVPAGHRLKSLEPGSNMLYGTGCAKHNCTDCSQCPRWFNEHKDCDFDYSREFGLRKKQREENR